MSLTRRGRAVVLLATMLLAFTGISVARTVSNAGTTTTHVVTHSITVRPGETLWQIAERIAPNTDPRDTIDALRDLNAIGPQGLIAGQRLLLPG
jgi:Tfp pilus assembly protein FimV